VALADGQRMIADVIEGMAVDGEGVSY